MKDGVLDDPTVAKVLDDDPLEERRGHRSVPDPVRVYDDDRTTGADAEARGLSALDALRPEEEAFALQQARQQVVELAAPAVG